MKLIFTTLENKSKCFCGTARLRSVQQNAISHELYKFCRNCKQKMAHKECFVPVDEDNLQNILYNAKTNYTKRLTKLAVNVFKECPRSKKND